jgi:Family of unknown function (DUF6788)
MASTKTPPEYEQLKQQLLTLDLVRPGSLVRRYMPCGKPGCRCMGTPPALHGPYYQWTYRQRGKTMTKRLTAAQATQCEVWIQNYRKLRALNRRLVGLSLKETDRILRTIS